MSDTFYMTLAEAELIIARERDPRLPRLRRNGQPRGPRNEGGRKRRRRAEGLGRTKVPNGGVDPQRYATHEMRVEVFNRDGGRCRYCSLGLTLQTANIDHVIAWKRSGRTDPINLVSSCWRCNKAKKNSHMVRPRHLGKKPRDPFGSRVDEG